MGVHDGHRQRMKERFSKTGLEGMSDYNALEMLLFYALPRKDTNLIAHRLIEQFGSLPKVLEAGLDELKNVEGVGDNASVLLKLVTSINKRYMEQIAVLPKRISRYEDVSDYLISKFLYEGNEACYAIFMDNRMSFICAKQISQGSIDGTSLSIRLVIESAVNCKAKNVIIAHNHPNSNVTPSEADKYSTEKLKKALKLVDIDLFDHVIVSGKQVLSMRRLGLM